MKKDLVEKKVKRERKAVTASNKFVSTLAIVSIVGFVGIVSYTLFGKDINNYVEAFWIFVIGVGLLIESKAWTLKRIKEEGFTHSNFVNLTTGIVGVIAIIAGILSLPPIRVDTPGFLAVKGIMGIIAIVVIF